MTQLPAVETEDAGRRIAQHLYVLMAYAGIRHLKDLAPRIDMTQQTLSRRMLVQGGWLFHEVVAIATYFGCSLDEMLNGLPTLEEWTARELCACRDSNPKPSDLVLIVNHELTPESPAAQVSPSLRVVSCSPVLTAVA